MPEIDEIRRLVRREEFEFTDHAISEAVDELISPAEIKEAILGGTIVEDYPSHRRGPCCLVHGVAANGRNIHVVLTTARAPGRIITVYEPRMPYWRTPTERAER